jgi:flagellar biosynthetic protein FliR
MLGNYYIYDLQAYIVVFARIAGVILLMPVFGGKEIPTHIRVFVALGLAVNLTPLTYPALGLPENLSPPVLAITAIRESIIGLCIGAIARAMFSVLEYVGSVVSLMSGLSIAMSFNPTMGGQIPITSNILVQVGTVLILSSDLHHLIIKGLIHSYTIFVNFSALAMSDFAQSFVETLNHMFKVGLQLSFPFLLVNIIFQFTLGIASRIIPQLQVFFVAMPLQTLLAFLIFGTILGSLLNAFLINFKEFFALVLWVR